MISVDAWRPVGEGMLTLRPSGEKPQGQDHRGCIWWGWGKDTLNVDAQKMTYTSLRVLFEMFGTHKQVANQLQKAACVQHRRMMPRVPQHQPVMRRRRMADAV